MENRSTIGTFAKGFFFSALSGALLVGIMAGVTFLGGPAVLGISGVTAMGLGQAATMACITAISAGLLGGIMRVASMGHSHTQTPHHARQFMTRPNDIAITAVSQNLTQPHMQAAMHGHAAEREAGVETSTTFRDRVGRKPSVTERADAILARYGQQPHSHAERVQLSKASARDAGIVH